MYVFVYSQLFMLTNYIQNKPKKENLEILDKKLFLLRNIIIESINSLWHLSALAARTKVSPIWLVRSQQLCRGTRHIGVALKLYSNGNDTVWLKIVSRGRISLCQTVACIVCCATDWWKDITRNNIISCIIHYLFMYVIINVRQLSEGIHPTLHILLENKNFPFYHIKSI